MVQSVLPLLLLGGKDRVRSPRCTCSCLGWMLQMLAVGLAGCARCYMAALQQVQAGRAISVLTVLLQLDSLYIHNRTAHGQGKTPIVDNKWLHCLWDVLLEEPLLWDSSRTEDGSFLASPATAEQKAGLQ